MKSYCTFLTLLLISTSALAKVTIQPRVTVGISDFERTIINPGASSATAFIGNQLDITSAEAGDSVSDTLFVYGLGASFITEGGYFLDAYYQEAADGSDGPVGPPRDSNISAVSAVEIQKDDYAISVGRAFKNRVSLAIGYKGGSSETTQDITLSERPNQFVYNLDLSGPFVSLSYGIPVLNGVIGFNVAVADLDAEYDAGLFNRVNNTRQASFLEGDATAVTYGINWKAPIADKWSYAVSLDYYDYSFNIDGPAQLTVSPDNMDFGLMPVGEIGEEALSLRFNLNL